LPDGNVVSGYKYEVAFSFLKEDEALALKINDLIQDRLSTFIYSKKQEEVAGTDGEETFSRVFGEEARIVVVLYRHNWGNTPWTRIEETAIRNRAYEEGYDFTIFIPLDKNPQLPKWLPKTQMWANLERYGVEGAVNIIETKVQQVGGIVREESVEEHAIRLKREMEAEQERKHFLASENGVNAANKEVENILEAMISLINKVEEKTGFKFRIQQNSDGNRWLEIFSAYHCISIDWYYHFTNTLENSHLDIELWKGGRPRSGRYYSRHREPLKILSKVFNFNLNVLGSYCWTEERKANSFTSQQLADYCVKLLMDSLHKEKLRSQT
jgi:hypothetical protein